MLIIVVDYMPNRRLVAAFLYINFDFIDKEQRYTMLLSNPKRPTICADKTSQQTVIRCVEPFLNSFKRLRSALALISDYRINYQVSGKLYKKFRPKQFDFNYIVDLFIAIIYLRIDLALYSFLTRSRYLQGYISNVSKHSYYIKGRFYELATFIKASLSSKASLVIATHKVANRYRFRTFQVYVYRCIYVENGLFCQVSLYSISV